MKINVCYSVNFLLKFNQLFASEMLNCCFVGVVF